MYKLNIHDTEADPVYGGLVETAALVCEVPVALIFLLASDRPWIKAHTGWTGASEIPLDNDFFSTSVNEGDILEVRDATIDARFSTNSLVTGSPGICFYAGVPLRLANGTIAGSLCVIDNKPKQLAANQRNALKKLACTTGCLLETRCIEHELQEAHAQELAHAHERIKLTTDGGKIGVWHWNSESGNLVWDDQMFTLHGLRRDFGDDASGHVTVDRWAGYLHPDDQKPAQELLNYALQNSDFYDSEYRLLSEDGNVRYFRATANITRNEAGEVIRLLGITWDVTPLKRLSNRTSGSA